MDQGYCLAHLSAIIRVMKLSSPAPVGRLAAVSVTEPSVVCELADIAGWFPLPPSLLGPPAAFGLGRNIVVVNEYSVQ